MSALIEVPGVASGPPGGPQAAASSLKHAALGKTLNGELVQRRPGNQAPRSCVVFDYTKPYKNRRGDTRCSATSPAKSDNISTSISNGDAASLAPECPKKRGTTGSSGP